jgi:hypothetical protein
MQGLRMSTWDFQETIEKMCGKKRIEFQETIEKKSTRAREKKRIEFQETIEKKRTRAREKKRAKARIEFLETIEEMKIIRTSYMKRQEIKRQIEQNELDNEIIQHLKRERREWVRNEKEKRDAKQKRAKEKGIRYDSDYSSGDSC